MGLEPKFKNSADAARLQWSPESAIPIGEDNRVEVKASDLVKFPYNAICALKTYYRRGARPLTGTGFFIDPRVVVTAAHCIYDRIRSIHEGWPEVVEVIPAVSAPGQLAAPYPVEYGGRGGTLRVPDGYIDSVATSGDEQGWRYDYGAIVLSSDLGAGCGAFSCDVPATAPLDGVDATLAGYPLTIENPDEKPLGGTQLCCHRLGNVSFGPGDVVHYEFDASPGQSGSPIWASLGDHRHVVVVVHGGNFDRMHNRGRRITREVLEDFGRWIAESRAAH